MFDFVGRGKQAGCGENLAAACSPSALGAGSRNLWIFGERFTICFGKGL